MRRYILQRLLLLIPTLLMILCINFALTQLAPGGPVEQAIHQAEQRHLAVQEPSLSPSLQYQGQQGLSPEMIEQIKKQYGFDQPAYQRFLHMLQQYAQLDLGRSFFKDQAVTTLIVERLPVSLSLGLWSTLLIYCIAIPLGMYKAKYQGSCFDTVSSLLLALAYAIPGFIFAIVLMLLFAGGSYWQWFPLQGLVSDDFYDLSYFGKIKDYFWHLALPTLAMVMGGFAGLSYLTKNSFLEQLGQQYVLVARAKGLAESRVLFKHVLRNALLTLLAGLPEALLGIFFVGNLLIEIVFNLDGLGLLGFEAIVQRDYPVMFGLLLILTVMGLLLRLLSDVLYRMVDPRINFAAQGG